MMDRIGHDTEIDGEIDGKIDGDIDKWRPMDEWIDQERKKVHSVDSLHHMEGVHLNGSMLQRLEHRMQPSRNPKYLFTTFSPQTPNVATQSWVVESLWARHRPRCSSSAQSSPF